MNVSPKRIRNSVILRTRVGVIEEAINCEGDGRRKSASFRLLLIHISRLPCPGSPCTRATHARRLKQCHFV